MMLGVSSCAHEKHSKEKCMNATKTRVFTIVVLAGLAAICAQRVRSGSINCSRSAMVSRLRSRFGPLHQRKFPTIRHHRHFLPTDSHS